MGTLGVIIFEVHLEVTSRVLLGVREKLLGMIYGVGNSFKLPTNRLALSDDQKFAEIIYEAICHFSHKSNQFLDAEKHAGRQV